MFTDKLTEVNHQQAVLKEPASTKVLECSMENASEIIEQVSLEEKQVQPVVQFGSFPPMLVNMVHILPQKFQAEDRNQEGQEIDPIPVSSEGSQVSMVQDEFEVATSMETEDESEEDVSINLSYPFEYPTTSMTQHVKPLYIKAFFDGI